MPQVSYLEILKKRNPGVYIEERNDSVYNITRFFNRFTLVVGVSKEGPVNLPTLVVSPENFEEIFGKQDYSLERKGSYFHRTVKEMLKEGGVICVNLRLSDSLLDKYNWQNLSCSSTVINSNRRSNPICDFFDTNDGFWRRSTKLLNEVAKDNLPDSDKKPLTFVNQSNIDVSILAFKSDLSGFDITVEDWYNGKYPEYLHPKDYISDYMVQVVVVEGNWTNYRELSVHPKWSEFFDKSGIKRNKLDKFYTQTGVRLIKRWQCCLIPYFVDKRGNDMWIETTINDDINETGVLCAYDSCVVETDFRTGLIDIIGDNLTEHKTPEIDFLSYKRYMTDFLVLSERLLDYPSNSFGHHEFNAVGRTQIYSEGYIHNVKLKPNIISSTSTVEVKPFDASNDAYGIINGNKIDIDSSIGTILALNDTVSIGNHVAFLIVLTSSGVEFRLGDETPLDQNLYLPHIDSKLEIVLGYYEIGQELDTNYFTNFFPIVIDENGFINPFNDGIRFDNSDENWIQKIVFENIVDENPQDYIQGRISHLWYYFSLNLVEEKSLVIDTNDNKQFIDWVEQNETDRDKYINIAIKDKYSNIYDVTGTDGMVSYYFSDIEQLDKTNVWKQSLPPLENSTSGILGYESFITESYLKGDINSGDPFFWGISEEFDVTFKYDNILNQNLIIIPEIIADNLYFQKKVIVENSEFNSGIFNFLNVIDYEDGYAIIVEEDVINEYVPYIRIFDAENPFIINLYTIGGETIARIEKWIGEPEELYRRLKEKEQEGQWAKTLEIESLLESNKAIVDYNRYSDKLEIGYFLLGNNKKIQDYDIIRNFTRIIDLQRLNDTDLLVITDAPIKYKEFDNDKQTNILKPIDNWVDTLDFKHLKGFVPRKDVFPDGSEEKQEEILNIISKGTKIHSSLASDRFEWRYLVDSFGNGLIEDSKHQLADLCSTKQFAFGFINMPSIKQFRKDGTKYTTNNSFDTNKLLMGGDRKNNVGNSYSFTQSGNTYCTYCTPYIVQAERGRFFELPPSYTIAQLYMKKHNDKNVKLWTPMAGINNSRLNIAGLEEIFNTEELNDLHNFGATTIASYKNQLFYLNSQNTADNDNSVLRNIHNRESLIELELSLYRNLSKYSWSSYTDTIVEKIVEVADEICSYYLENDALSNYKNEFITSNELKDNQIGILNTYVELNGVMETIELRVSVLRTGGISLLS